MSIEGLTEQDTALRAWLLAEADQHGNAVVEVPPDQHGAPYTFTVGAWRRFGVPEAVVIGLPKDMGPVLVNAYVEQARAGRRFVPGQLYDDFFDGVPVTVERVHKGHYPEFLGSAFLIYRTGDFPAVQLIVPTPEGQWPWNADAPEGFADWQPILTDSGAPESWTPGVNGP
ncbi:uncharacterized protein DUF4262 [Herbihabitans rhizosphaerae]|uniref:Uncharacterized protein DUF4262 n=1 Tax=Herbihabitans rhizosphaerae TaxID=1872711 RepID=A0A4Q7KJD9_9PSEU|nr:DUF4262 domain-containing protein [Herbihabitans rhizosphaerae]RZS34355.1 uncharacterized protein DUF4262 [Herbihabitans rhizosphaerae]